MTTANESGRGDVEDLLPWHAAGTLSPRDMQRVETALAADPELARRYQLVREELAQTIHLNETLGAPSARGVEALFAKIDAEPARAPAFSGNLGARIRDFFAALSPRTVAWSAAVAALAIVLQAGVIGGVLLNENDKGGYETASAPSTIFRDGTYALVRFQPQASAADITRFLDANKFNIAEGPLAGGLFRVRIAPTKLAKTDRDRLIATLQTDQVVSFIAAIQ
jgi:anti-sigma factor RsiW